MQKKTNLQDLFLLRIRQDRLPVTLFLMNGFQMRGIVTGYDPFEVIYKHAVSTIVPIRPVELWETEEGSAL